jgi:hypothetical protein
VNPDWHEGEPGTFAVIIGSSAYKHLAEGDFPAAETFGLGQLRVSAFTAFEVFRWLTERYRVDGCPLAMCWLLLSPTAAECAYEPRLAQHLTPPTFDNCQQALRCWQHHMQQLPRAAAQTSRALFFFSGHGLEVHQEQQILLPSDYLAPPVPSWNDAISTENLKRGLASLAVPYQFFFLDACRNDHYALRSKKVTGAEILPEDEAALVNAARVAPLLYATASGQQAFQPPEPQRGISLFGRALLDGLCGTPDIQLDCQGGVCFVKLYSLQGYVKQRVVELLAQAGAQVHQPIKLSGIVDNEAITCLEHAAVIASRPGLAEMLERSAGQPVVAGGATARERADRVLRLLGARFTSERMVEPTLRRSLWSTDFNIGHALFGSENVTAIWSHRVRLYALHSRRWLDNPDTLVLHRIDRDAGTRSYRAEISAVGQDHIGHWLEIVDYTGEAHGCVLPADQIESPRYVIEFDVTYEDNGPRRLSRLSAYLSTESPGPLGVAAELWQRYRTADVGEAVSAFEMSVLELMVREKLESPLAATVAALILLRANRLDLLHDWVRNLANWFEARPDGAVLWAEQLLRQQPRGIEPAIADASEYVAKLLQRGLPHTSEGLAYAARLCTTLGRPGVHISPDFRGRLDQLSGHLEAALAYFRPGGLFTTYTGFTPHADPITFLGPFI